MYSVKMPKESKTTYVPVDPGNSRHVISEFKTGLCAVRYDAPDWCSYRGTTTHKPR